MLIEYTLLALTVTLSAVAFSMWVAQISAQAGKVKAIFGLAGIEIALGVIALIIMLPVYIYRTAEIMHIVHYAGALSLIYYAWSLARFKPEARPLIPDKSLQLTWWGFKRTIVDIRSYLFFATLTPVFIAPQKPFVLEYVISAMVFIAMVGKVNGLVALFGKKVCQFIQQPERVKIYKAIFIILLIISAVFMTLKHTI